MPGLSAVGQSAIGTWIDPGTTSVVFQPYRPVDEYPLSFPTNQPVRSATMDLEVAVGQFRDGFNQQDEVYEYSGTLWRLRVVVDRMTHSEAGVWRSFLAKLVGPRGRFFAPDPNGNQPRGNVNTSNTIQVDTVNNARSIDLKGFDVSTTNVFLKGDYIQFNETNELKQVTNEPNSNGSGVATVEFEPATRTTPSANSNVEVANPKGLFRLDQSDVSWRSETPPFVDLEFQAREKV